MGPRREQPGVHQSLLTKDLLGPVAGEGLFTSAGDTWCEQRRRIQPVFHPDQIVLYGDLVVDAVERRLSALDAADRIEVNEEMRALALDIVPRALFGVDSESSIEQIGHDLDISSPGLAVSGISFFPRESRRPGTAGSIDLKVRGSNRWPLPDSP